jgi:hypothetical protein
MSQNNESQNVTIQAFCLRQNDLMAKSFEKSFCHQIILPLFLLFAVTHLNSYVKIIKSG